MKLKKELKFMDVFSIASGAMISSGLFILPGLAYYKSGPAVIIAYLLAGILVIPSLLSKAELATAMPKAGGDYFFVGRSMGAGFGTLAGISAWFSLAFKSSFALLGIGAFASLIFPGITMLEIKLIASFACVFFAILNIIGTKHASKLQVALVMLLIVILIIFVTRGIPEVKSTNFDSFMKGDLRTLLMTSGLIFVSYGGLTKVASIAEEVENPSKNIPLGMLASFGIVTLLYVFAVFVTVGVMGDNLLRSSPLGYSLTPLTDAAGVIMGSVGSIALSIAAILAFVSTANAGIMAASRSPLAMSRDNLLPSSLSKINDRYKTPHVAIIVTSLFMIVVILVLDLEMLVKTASTIKILLFSFVNLSVIIMRESSIQNYRPKFKSPLYPWIQIISVLIYGYIIFEMGKTPILISGVFMLSGLIWYWFYGRIRANKESALLNIIRRVKDSKLRTPMLENELKEIIRERDEIQKDRFDKIIENCNVLDIDETIDKLEFFRIISKNMCDKINQSCDDFLKNIIDREEESSTALTENLAIPHIIIDGEKKFDILLARCKKGIYFSEDAPAVKMVFVITGTKDERTFHLRALAAIAQIVQNSNFEKKWMSAKNPQQLRDLILLGERRR